MSYDGLHRIATKSYNDGTPQVTYQYYLAGSSSPNVGKLMSASSSVGSMTYGSYNAFGNALTSTQTIVGSSGNLAFSYDWYLNGGMKTLTYPSGRVVNYSVDDAGRTNKVYATGRTYADLTAAGITYPFTPDGRIAQMKLGNNLYETRDYRPAGQTTYYRLGTALGAGDVQQLEYNFDGSNNNGNLVSQRTTRPGNNSWQQSFTYDGANRLATAGETFGWSQTYAYDRWGNRSVATTGLAHSDSRESTSLSDYSPSTNRLNLAGAQYDSAGNQTVYGAYTLAYDAEGRNTTVTSTGSGSGSFAYDGDGHRVKKVWTPYGGSTVTTYYGYDALGRLATENSDQSPTGTGTTWLSADMLGSVRAITSDTGSVLECYDYLPFGRMLSSADNGRNAVGCYQSNPDVQISSRTEQKFTGKERDQETGLDFFEARYYSAAQGRFSSPDPSNLSVDFWVPQTWNRYAYVGNNPLMYIDENGLWWKSTHDRIYTEAFPGLSAEDLKAIKDASAQADVRIMGVDSQHPGMSFVHHMADADDPDPIHAMGVAEAAESNFIQQNQAAARAAQADWIASGHTGISPNALMAFGNAVHPVADSTSPSHEGYQAWSGLGLSAIWHGIQENPIFYSGQRRDFTIVQVRMLFLDTFGSVIYTTATSKPPNPEPRRKRPKKPRCLKDSNGQCVNL